ncbi:Aste57867_3662 [Aphanomyces stellatus]|uniref:Aste57867_3662 protein n=1 Tax=Aphanomyces stellatus TaxID=120398 RepID=A0A485KEJ9_9STRA|nr:hypothetical protein As57867_003651 [Aphanomyces stellatus]VFT80817.1 Aste57867_3662 [Aphanomyces stellatus]
MMMPRMFTVEPVFTHPTTSQPPRQQPKKALRWPSVLDADLTAMTDAELIVRGHSMAKVVVAKSKGKVGVQASHERFTIVAADVVSASLDQVLDVFSRDSQLGFQAFLVRVFEDALKEAESTRRATPPGMLAATIGRRHSSARSLSTADEAIPPLGCTAAVKRLHLHEKRLFTTQKHQLDLLDYVEKLHDKAFVRAFKSLDHPASSTKGVHHMTNLLFGFHMEEIQPGRVHIAFYGQHVGPKVSYTHTVLRQLGDSIGVIASAVWRRRLAQHATTPMPRLPTSGCHLCCLDTPKRNQTTCRLCDHTICIHCSTIERAEAAFRVEFDMRVCHLCRNQCQSNLPLTNKLAGHSHRLPVPTQLLDDDDDDELPRISEQLEAGQTRHCSARKLSSRRVMSAVLAPHDFSTPRTAASKYVASPQPSAPTPTAHPSLTKTSAAVPRVSPRAEPVLQVAHANAALAIRLEALCVSLAAGLDCRLATVCLLHHDGFALKAATGPKRPHVPRHCALNTATMTMPSPLVVPDASADARFHQSPRVTGDEAIRFYVGMPLTTTDGIHLGAVAVADAWPRDTSRFTPAQANLLAWYAATIVTDITQCGHVVATTPAAALCI